MALSEYDKKYLNAEQQAAVQAATDYGHQTGDWATAHTMAEAIRGQRNYSGGTDGSEYIQSIGDPVKENSYNGSLTGYLRQSQTAATDAALAGLKGAYEKALTSYDATAARLPQTYNAARNSAAAQNAMARKNFDERANASGLSSGAAGQADLARSSVYRGALAGIDQQQANALSDIELAKSDRQKEYETAIAQTRASGDAALANALYSELLRLQDQQRADERYEREWARNNDRYQQEWARNDARYQQGLDREDESYARTLALKYGRAWPSTLYTIHSLEDLAY